jgi:hypothetical protein
VNQTRKLTDIRPVTEATRTKPSSLLRTKMWTGVPCSCHEPNAPTHWSGRGGETPVLQACSQKQKCDAVDRSRKTHKKQAGAHRLCRASVSDTSAGEDIKKNEVVGRVRRSDRYTSQVMLRYVIYASDVSCNISCSWLLIPWRKIVVVVKLTVTQLVKFHTL